MTSWVVTWRAGHPLKLKDRLIISSALHGQFIRAAGARIIDVDPGHTFKSARGFEEQGFLGITHGAAERTRQLRHGRYRTLGALAAPSADSVIINCGYNENLHNGRKGLLDLAPVIS